MSRGSRTWSFVVTSAAAAAVLLASAIAPVTAGAAIMRTNMEPFAPTVGSSATTSKPPSNIAVAAKRIVNLAGKRRPVPKPPVRYGPWRTALCSWYDEPQPLAGGGYLKPGMMIVAHKTLAFGTRIQFSYRGRTCIATVQDRGPYVGNREFDLGPGTAAALHFDGVDQVAYRFVY